MLTIRHGLVSLSVLLVPTETIRIGLAFIAVPWRLQVIDWIFLILVLSSVLRLILPLKSLEHVCSTVELANMVTQLLEYAMIVIQNVQLVSRSPTA